MTGLYRLFTKKGQLIALIIGLLSLAIVFGTIVSGLGSAGYDAGMDLNRILKDGGGDGFNMFNLAIIIPAILIVLCFAIALVFGITQLISNPKGSIIALVAAAVIVIIFFVLYSGADVETAGRLGALHDKFEVSPNVSKFISGGIKTTVGLAILAFIAMVVFEIYNMFK